jgi:hypothetical protein
MSLLLGLLLLAAAEPVPNLALPPALEDRLVYYRSFDTPDGRPELNTLPAQELRAPTPTPGGWSGRCGARAALRLRSPGFSPHAPLSILFWWNLPRGCAPNGGYGLCALRGLGHVSVFGRGGPWCGLSDTGAVLQIWDLAGIVNVNDIYDDRPRVRLGLDQPDRWHHTALTFAGGRLVRLYTDGQPSTSATIAGRTFRAEDELRQLELGSDGPDATRLDEVIVLQRTLTEGEVADYVTGASRLREVGWL